MAEAERKQVTVLFSDLSGFTTLSERLDPEDTREIMARIFGSAATIVGRYDGRLEKFIGDAWMAIFGVPQSREDDPVRAVRSALDLHRMVAELAPEVEQRAGVRVALHSGIHTGLVVTGDLVFDRGTAGPLGDTINVAARLMALAPAGEIYVGHETRRLVSDAIAFEDLGERELKGRSEPVTVARVCGTIRDPDPSQRRHRGAFVGRQEELGSLLGAVERLRDGQGAVLAISGDAGTGKTRLFEELRAQVTDDVQWLEGRSYLYAESIPYFPLIDLLSRSWGIAEGDSAAEVKAKVEAGVGALVDDPAAVLPALAHLYDFSLSGSPTVDREAFPTRLLDAVRGLLEALTARAPTVICLQDLHWADASTVTLLRALARDLDTPVLLLLNHRPEFELGEGVRRIELKDLSPRQARELLASLLEGAMPPEDLVRFVVERSDGNPFYVEEVVHSLVETHVLHRSDGAWSLDRPLTELEVPTTIRGVVAARIDRLDEGKRRVLREAAVVGREFLHRVIAEVTREHAVLGQSLEGLEAADLIRTKSPEPDLEYIFKHALTQEVAYDGLLKSERQKLHERVAFVFEGLVSHRVSEFVETLAYHFLHGGVVDKAVHYLIEAGRKCVARYAIADAAAHYRHAYELLTTRKRTPAEDRTLVELLNAWSLVYYYQGDCVAWRRLLDAHRDVAERVGDPELLSLYLGWVGWVHWFHQENAPALEVLDSAVQLAEQAGSQRALGYAEALRAWALLPLGRTREAIAAGERSVAVGREFPEEPYLVFKPMAAIAFAAAIAGDLERAREASEEILRIADRTGNSRAGVLGHCMLAVRHMVALEPERAIDAAQSAIDTSLDTTYWSMSCAFSSIALAAAEQWEGVTRIVETALPTSERLALLFMASFLRIAQGLARMGRGELSAGVDAVEAMRRSPPSPLAKLVADFSLGVAYSRIARGQVSAPVPVLLRNPAFVIQHALPARRKARAILERIADTLPDGMQGYSGQAMLELALLHAHRGERKRASARATQAIAIFEQQGANEALRQAQRLVEQA